MEKDSLITITKDRTLYLDILKIIACFLVVVNHAGIGLLSYAGYTKGTTLFYSTCFSICKIAVPIFIMITGSLLLKKEETYKSIIKRIFRIVVPIICVSIYYYFIDQGHVGTDIKNFITAIIQEPLNMSLWYLYMLIGLYIMTPFIKKMIKNFDKKDFILFSILTLIIPGAIRLLKTILKIQTSGFFEYAIIPESIGYYVTGYFISTQILNKRIKNIAIISFLISTICFILRMYIPFLMKGELDYSLDDAYSFITIVMAISIFIVSKYYVEKIKYNKYLFKVIEELSKITFGIYLIHPIFISKIQNSNIIQGIFGINAYIGVIALEISTFVFCGIITFILRKIPIVKKFL